MLKIAITGNIASGKSFVLDFFAGHGFETLSLDSVVHKIYENESFKQKLSALFGTDKRSEISNIVFNNSDKMHTLEKLIYPLLLNEMKNFFTGKETVVAEVPMLFEAGFDRYFDKIIFVSCDEKIRKERLIKRRGYAMDEAQKRISAQGREELKIKKSDYIIYNNAGIEDLIEACKKIIKSLR